MEGTSIGPHPGFAGSTSNVPSAPDRIDRPLPGIEDVASGEKHADGGWRGRLEHGDGTMGSSRLQLACSSRHYLACCSRYVPRNARMNFAITGMRIEKVKWMGDIHFDMPDEPESKESVEVTVELSGGYEQIAEIIGREGSEYEEIAVVADDLGAVLTIVTSTGGATKSRIAEELPPTVSTELDADAVIHVLRVLELYDLVTLDGNTWRPGAALAPG